MELDLASFARNLFSPPAALPIVREPNRRWARGAATKGYLRLRVAEVIVETPTTRTFVFEDAGLAYRAGQHLTVVAELDGRTTRRCYSFSSSPASKALPSITVKRVEGGAVSGWMHDQVKRGDVIRALPPSGRFTVDLDASASRHFVMVAGGVGITPILSMAETVLREDSSSRVTLLYGSRNEDEIIFLGRIRSLEREFAGRLRLILGLDAAGATWTGVRGRMDGSYVLEALPDANDALWYVCGPAPMMDSVVSALSARGVAADHVHLERFEYAETATARVPEQAALIVFAASGREVVAAPGTTILDAAEKAGIALPSSCRMGGCGACKVKVDGRVVAAEPNCLTEAEKSEGHALACCSWADGRVVLRDF